MKKTSRQKRRLIPSGIDWIGDMPEGWKHLAMKRVTRIVNGREIENELEENDEGAVAVYGSGGVFKFTDKVLYDGEAVLFGRKGTIGKPIYVDDSFWVVDTMYLSHYDPSEMCAKYAYYAYVVFDWRLYTTQTALPSIVASEALAHHFPIPPLPEQTAIAARLDVECGRIDSLKAKIEKEIAALEEYRKSLITKCVTKGLDAKAKLKSSGVDWIGDVPEGWSVMRLSYQYSVQLGKMLDSAQITGECLVPYLRNQDVQWNRVNTDDLPMMDIRPDEYDRCSARRGDLLVCEGGEIGRSAIWRSDEPVFYQKAIMRLRPYDFRFNCTSWMYYLMCAATASGAFDNATGKSTIAHLPAEKLEAAKLPFPSIDVQLKIAAYLDKKCAAIDAVLAKRRKQLEGLAEYRKSLIYAYVTGKKEVAA